MEVHSPAYSGLKADGVRYPGFDLPFRAPSRQLRYGEAVRLDLCKGDLITLVQDEGGAVVQLFALDDRGADALGLLGLESAEPDNRLTFDAREMNAWLAANGGTDWPGSAYVFDARAGAGDRMVLKAEKACTVWAALPVLPGHAKARGGTITIETSRNASADERLPDPLGEIGSEFRVARATAESYRVRKGEYIQIIDVDGRQCSDFMALRASALDDGLERFIDSTVTRTMAGGAYPLPGLYDKFYDQDMRPLLAVVQDTVGRHDTFALACTARGYEDRGYPGHVNCSDNISDVLEPHGVARKLAWPAVNFFFNSWILPADNRLRSDEAWSRPGDYVVMQALDDLVCVSTACPDDVDPINGWNPTDIHVRVYRPEKPIRRAVAHRPFAENEAVMTAQSAFHERTSELTRSFHVARDLWLPASYESTRAIEEYWACREAVTVQDMSSLRKFDIAGPDAERLLNLCLTRDVTRLSVNRGTYALMTTDSGGVIDDGTLFRLAPESFRWCCGSEESARQLKTVAEERGYKAWIRSQWSSMPNLAVQGPRSRELLSRIVFTQPTHPKLENLKWFGFTIARIGDREGPPFMLTRTGFTGELGYEIFCNQADAVAIWDAVMTAGDDLGIVPMGSEALDMLRIEAGLMVAGAEFGPDIDAFEAGLGFAVDLAKDEFIGRDALLRNSNAMRRNTVGLVFDGSECPSHGDTVYAGNIPVGVITSATPSPMLRRPIAMARLNVEHAQTGTMLEAGRLDGQMKRLSATVTDIPFHDPKRERARA